MMKITLAENFRAIFYVPFYALKVLGLAEREGVAIEWLPPGAPGGAIEQIKSGAIDLTWGGPMRVMKDHDSTPQNGASLVCFGAVVARDPFCLVGRTAPAGFELADLAALRLGVVSEVPTPWLCLQADLHDAGVAVEAMIASGRVRTGMTMAQQLQALKDGLLDVIQLFEPHVSQALSEGSGKLLYSASARGPTVYTTFICSRDGLAARRAAFAAIYRALDLLQPWIASHGWAELARITAAFFPDVPNEIFRAAVERYCQSGVWARTPRISEPGIDRLSYSLQRGGLIGSRIDYASCVHAF